MLLTEAARRRFPDATIFASNGLADSAYVDPAGGIPPALRLARAGRLARRSIRAPTRPRGRRSSPPTRARFGAPEPSAIFGYEAMSLMLRAIARATDRGRKAAERSKVAAAILSTPGSTARSATYRIDRPGTRRSTATGSTGSSTAGCRFLQAEAEGLTRPGSVSFTIDVPLGRSEGLDPTDRGISLRATRGSPTVTLEAKGGL